MGMHSHQWDGTGCAPRQSHLPDATDEAAGRDLQDGTAGMGQNEVRLIDITACQNIRGVAWHYSYQTPRRSRLLVSLRKPKEVNRHS